MLFGTLLERLAKWLGFVAGALFVVAMAATVYEVAMRYFLNAPTIWAHELTTLLCGAGYLIAGVYTQQRGGHIAITLLHDRARPVVRRLMDVGIHFASFAYFALLAWAAHKRAWISLSTWEGTGTAWNAPIPALLVPLLMLTAIVLALQMLLLLVREVTR